MNLNSPSHPIWSFLRLIVMTVSLWVVLYLTASEFDATEKRTVITMFLIGGAGEGFIQAWLRMKGAIGCLLPLLWIAPYAGAGEVVYFSEREASDARVEHVPDAGRIKSEASPSLTVLLQRIEALETELDAERNKPPQTAMCQCQGSKRSVCKCLQNGVKCGCNTAKGSEWFIGEHGKAYAKTGLYGDPFGTPPSQQATSMPPGTQNSPQKAVSGAGVGATLADGSSPVQRSPDGWVWYDNKGVRWFIDEDDWSGTLDGIPSVDGKWFFRDGRAYPTGASNKPVVDLSSPQERPSGQWVRQCRNGVCRTVWVPFN